MATKDRTLSTHLFGIKYSAELHGLTSDDIVVTAGLPRIGPTLNARRKLSGFVELTPEAERWLEALMEPERALLWELLCHHGTGRSHIRRTLPPTAHTSHTGEEVQALFASSMQDAREIRQCHCPDNPDYAILLGLASLLLALIFIGSSSTPVDGSAQVDLNDIREDVVKDMYDASGKMINLDRQLQLISKDNAGGFGGYYFSDDDSHTVYVYMQDVTKAAEAETAFRAAQGKDAQYTRIVPVQGRYSMDDLVDWFYQILGSL